MTTTRAPSQILGLAPVTVGANASGQVISRPFAVRAETAASGIRVDIAVSAATVAVGITVKLQHSYDGGTTWDDVDATNAKISVTATGRFSLAMSPMNSTFAPKFPLRPLAQLVVSSGAGDSCTISDIRVTQVD